MASLPRVRHKTMKTKQILTAWLRFSALGVAATALAQPVITTQPRTQFQWENKRVSLEVRATGAAPFRYQWQFNGADLPEATNRVFNLPRVQLTHDGSYRVVVTDAAGGVTPSEVARLMVRAWPAPSGPEIPELARLDTNMEAAMLANAIPGASLAVVKDGRLVFARAYGFADVENNEPYQPDSLCRGGSLAKTITAATALKLVEEGRLDLDAPVFGILDLEIPHYDGALFDTRWTNVTMRQLLYHSGGWDGDAAKSPLGRTGFDPTAWPDWIAKDLDLPGPATPTDLVRWMMGKPLQYKPGTRGKYSNFGYDLAGVVVERAAGVPYESAARDLLAQAGATRMRIAGNTRADRRPGEVVYHLHKDITPALADPFEPRPFEFDLPYAWPPSLYAAGRGWLISAIDFARFVAALDGQSSYPDILSTNSIAAMLAPVRPALFSDGYLGLGWDVVRPAIGTWYKRGTDMGSCALAYKFLQNTIAVFTINTYGADDLSRVWDPLATSLQSLRTWPAHDLFPASLSYDAWRRKSFSAAELDDPRVSGDDGDPDGDGVSNLWEYATGIDPRATSEPPRLAASLVEGDSPTLSIAYRRLLLAHEVEYTLEDSADLTHWSPSVVEPDDLGLNADGTVTARVAAQLSQPGRFFRLKITRRAQ